MKKAIVVVALAFAVVALMGCPTVNLPLAGGVGTASIVKTGTAEGTIILGAFGNVQAGIADAAKNGGITRVASVDIEKGGLMLGGITRTYRVTVTGE